MLYWILFGVSMLSLLIIVIMTMRGDFSGFIVVAAIVVVVCALVMAWQYVKLDNTIIGFLIIMSGLMACAGLSIAFIWIEENDLTILGILLCVLIAVGLGFLANGATYESKIVEINEPKVSITTYEPFSGGDTSEVGGYITGGLTYTRGAIYENGIYKVFYLKEDGEITRIMVLEMPQKDTELILSDKMLVEETQTLYYSEDRNKEPYDIIERKTEKKYKFYITKEAFSKIEVDGN